MKPTTSTPPAMRHPNQRCSSSPGPTDAWITLAGLARETERIRLGTLLTAGTFRLPGPLAIAVAQIDAMSGGRIELGLGAGWFEQEHKNYGIPFSALGERFERLEDGPSSPVRRWPRHCWSVKNR